MVAVLGGRWGPPVAAPAVHFPRLFVRLITGLSRTRRDRAGPFSRYRDAHTWSVADHVRGPDCHAQGGPDVRGRGGRRPLAGRAAACRGIPRRWRGRRRPRGRARSERCWRFRAYVMEALGKRPAVLTIDATTLTSVDSVGLAGVVRGPSRRDRRGRGVPGQRRIARLFGMLLRTPASTRCYPTSDAAVAVRPPDGESPGGRAAVGPGGRCPTG